MSLFAFCNANDRLQKLMVHLYRGVILAASGSSGLGARRPARGVCRPWALWCMQSARSPRERRALARSLPDAATLVLEYTSPPAWPIALKPGPQAPRMPELSCSWPVAERCAVLIGLAAVGLAWLSLSPVRSLACAPLLYVGWIPTR